MTTPIASIVIPTRGGAQRLPVLFRALCEQDRDDFEVIPVLDGDIDGSRQVVEEWLATSPLNIRPVVFPDNRGRSAALNAGIDAALGEIVIRSDDDLEPRSDFVSGHVARHQASDQPIGVIGPCANILPDNAYAHVYGRPASNRALAAMVATEPSSAWRHWAANVSVSAETAAAMGGYDTRYRRYGWEDVDYGYRLHVSGFPVVIAPELTADHHMAATTTVIRALRALHSGAARETFVQIHGEAALAGAGSHPNLWQTIVNVTAKVITEQSLRVLGSGMDALIRRLPQPVAHKLVALLVESAGVAGVKYPHRARAQF